MSVLEDDKDILNTQHCCDFTLVLTCGVQVIAIFQNVGKLEVSWLWITHGIRVWYPGLKYCIQENNLGSVQQRAEHAGV